MDTATNCFLNSLASYLSPYFPAKRMQSFLDMLMHTERFNRNFQACPFNITWDLSLKLFVVIFKV